jgi:hypothetical protein
MTCVKTSLKLTIVWALSFVLEDGLNLKFKIPSYTVRIYNLCSTLICQIFIFLFFKMKFGSL